MDGGPATAPTAGRTPTRAAMGKGRLEAFSDGVLAIIITIMVLELKVPKGESVESLRPLGATFFSYVLSFIYVGIYWNNHHHMLHAARKVTGPVLWANLHLLFWLSLLPFTTAWSGSTGFATLPSALYGLNLLAAALAYWGLQQSIIVADGSESVLKRAVGRDRKAKLSIGLYVAGVVVASWSPRVSQVIYSTVAGIWLIPDRRIENAMRPGGS